MGNRIAKWEEDKNVSNKLNSGRPNSLTESDKEIMKKLINDDRKKYGINMSRWDTKGLQIYFYVNGKDVSREAIRLYLHALGGHYVKALHKYA